MKSTFKFFAPLLSLLLIFSSLQLVSAAEENTLQVVLEDVTNSADTLAGEAKVKISVKGIEGSLTSSQLTFHFTGNGTFKSVAYAKALTQPVKSTSSSQPFFILPIDAKSANAAKSFDVAFSGGAAYTVPVQASGTELCTVSFDGEPGESLTLALDDLENSFCVEAPNLTGPQNHVKDAASLTVSFSTTTNTGVKATVNVKLDELKDSGGFADASDIMLKLTNTETGQIRSVALADATKNDAVSYTFELDGIVTGRYDVALAGDGFVTKAIANTAFNTNKTITLTSDNFYAGDVNADGKLTLRDYNRFISLYGKGAAAFDGVDYNRDNALTNFDLLAFITAAKNHIEAEERGTIPAKLKAVASKTSVKKDDTFTVTLSLDAGSEAVNTYYIKGTYPKDVATLTKAECTETASADKAVNIAEDGSFVLMNHVSDGTKKDIYTLTFKAQKSGSFALSFAETAGALLYDTENGSADRLLNITTENATVTVSGSTESGGNTTGGGGGGGGGGNTGGGSIGGGGTSGNTQNEHAAYVTGYEDNTIRPNSSITRAEAAAMLSRISSDFNTDQSYDVSAFGDVAADAWYAKYIGYAAQKGIVTGYEDASFHPNDSITREEFATMLCRFKGYSLSDGAEFSDVPEGHWARTYIKTMQANGIIGGYEDGTFGLGKQIVRAEVITMINRAQGRTPNEDKIASYIAAKGYPATDVEGHWAAAQIIEAAVSHSVSLLH